VYRIKHKQVLRVLELLLEWEGASSSQTQLQRVNYVAHHSPVVSRWLTSITSHFNFLAVVIEVGILSIFFRSRPA
jgi:hypothetical protein